MMTDKTRVLVDAWVNVARELGPDIKYAIFQALLKDYGYTGVDAYKSRVTGIIHTVVNDEHLKYVKSTPEHYEGDFTIYVPDERNRPADHFIPTEKAHFCNQEGCKDAWWIGGSYGSYVCKNPNHKDE